MNENKRPSGVIGRDVNFGKLCKRAYHHNYSIHHDAFCRPVIASAIPPRMKAPARINLNEISSARNATPPHAASTGTESCTIAARVAVRPRRAAYQITYPTPEAAAPERTARRIPDWESSTPLNVTNRTKRISGTARIKLPAVSARGDSVPRPRNEYTPHAIPAMIINEEPSSDGALRPGITKYTSPPRASNTPSHSRSCGRSPERSATRIIVTCTLPKRINAPVPAVRLR